MRIYEDLRLVQSRLALLQALMVLLVVGLMVQFWNLQVVRARHFRDQAENNRSRLVTLAAPRGALVDRNGKLLVGNRPSFSVLLVPEHAENLDRVVERLASALGMGEAAIRGYESGRSSPSAPRLAELAWVLGPDLKAGAGGERGGSP